MMRNKSDTSINSRTHWRIRGGVKETSHKHHVLSACKSEGSHLVANDSPSFGALVL